MDARSANSATGIRRRRRASRMSLPIFRSARRTGMGTGAENFAISSLTSTLVFVIKYNVRDNGRKESLAHSGSV